MNAYACSGIGSLSTNYHAARVDRLISGKLTECP